MDCRLPDKGMCITVLVADGDCMLMMSAGSMSMNHVRHSSASCTGMLGNGTLLWWGAVHT